MAFDPGASDESCRCPTCHSYRPCYPFGTDDPCLACRDSPAGAPTPTEAALNELAAEGKRLAADLHARIKPMLAVPSPACPRCGNAAKWCGRCLTNEAAKGHARGIREERAAITAIVRRMYESTREARRDALRRRWTVLGDQHHAEMVRLRHVLWILRARDAPNDQEPGT